MCNESALCYPAASKAPIASRRSLLIRQPWSPIRWVLDTLDFWVKNHRRTQKLAWVSKYSKSPTCEPSRCELLKMQTCVPSVSGMNEIAACPPSPFADNPSALPSLTSPVDNSTCLFTPCQPLMPAVILYYCTFQGTVL